MSFLDYIFPKKCVGCRRFGNFLCADCFSKISHNQNFQCPVCLKGSVNSFTHSACEGKYSINGVISTVVYNNITRKIIRQFKYKPHISKLAEIISEIMNEELAQNESFYYFIEQFKPVVVPIPLSSSRERERGYNHAGLLASYVAKYFNLSVRTDLLVRIKDTKPQYKLNKRERHKNVQGAFGIAKNAKIPNSAILIDDVATTLSTLKEAAKVLKRNGSKHVLGVSFAREI